MKLFRPNYILEEFLELSYQRMKSKNMIMIGMQEYVFDFFEKKGWKCSQEVIKFLIAHFMTGPNFIINHSHLLSNIYKENITYFDAC